MNTDEIRNRNFLNVKEVAAFLSDEEPLDERTVRRAIEMGQIPSVKIGTKTLIPASALLAMVAAPDLSPTTSEAPAPDVVAIAAEILRGALRALETLQTAPGISAGISELSNADVLAINAGQGNGSSIRAGDSTSPLSRFGTVRGLPDGA